MIWMIIIVVFMLLMMIWIMDDECDEVYDDNFFAAKPDQYDDCKTI